MRSKTKGFTLIELLVVIAIIGVLVSIILANIRNVRAKARDVKRLANVKQIQTALALYYADFGQYPSGQSDGVNGQGPPNCGGWDCSTVNGVGVWGEVFIPALTSNYISKVPIDPVNVGCADGVLCPGSSNYYYRYLGHFSGAINGAVSGPCASVANGGSYKYLISINSFETSPVPYVSPAFCGASIGAWVAGGFESQ
ncbi:MAG: type II secretion system protein [Patescibacteria group bacterium]